MALPILLGCARHEYPVVSIHLYSLRSERDREIRGVHSALLCARVWSVYMVLLFLGEFISYGDRVAAYPESSFMTQFRLP